MKMGVKREDHIVETEVEVTLDTFPVDPTRMVRVYNSDTKQVVWYGIYGKSRSVVNDPRLEQEYQKINPIQRVR